MDCLYIYSIDIEILKHKSLLGLWFQGVQILSPGIGKIMALKDKGQENQSVGLVCVEVPVHNATV